MQTADAEEAVSHPWMPLYVANYVADTAHLNAAESGAYLHLIMHYWLNSGLPDDDRLLARIAKMTPKQWKAARPLIEPFFEAGWKHLRVEFELTEAARRSAAGKAGGEASGRSRREAAAQRSTNDRSTTNEQSFNDQGNDPPTIPEPLHLPLQLQRKKEKEDTALRADRPDGEKKSRKKPKTRISDDWRPGPHGVEYAKSLGLFDGEIKRESERFRNNARQNDRTVSDWDMAWRNWVIKACEFLGRDPPKSTGESAIPKHGETLADGTVFLKAETHEYDAWADYERKNGRKHPPRYLHGGWTFPSRWPPGVIRETAQETAEQTT